MPLCVADELEWPFVLAWLLLDDDWAWLQLELFILCFLVPQQFDDIAYSKTKVFWSFRFVVVCLQKICEVEIYPLSISSYLSHSILISFYCRSLNFVPPQPSFLLFSVSSRLLLYRCLRFAFKCMSDGVASLHKCVCVRLWVCDLWTTTALFQGCLQMDGWIWICIAV